MSRPAFALPLTVEVSSVRQMYPTAQRPTAGSTIVVSMKTIQWNVAALVGIAAFAMSAAASAAPQATDKPDNHVVQAKDAVVNGAKVVGEKTKDGLSKTGEVMTDGWITTRVNARFVHEDLLKGSNINVDTDKHVVTLKGTVMTTAGRTKAGAIARGTEGVRGVVNRLTIASKK
jgi:osmotically-inducible protein OsmY